MVSFVWLSCKLVCLNLGLYPNVVKVPGVDSFQCLNLAFGVVRTALEKFIESGGQLYWKDGSGPLTLVDIFS